MRKSFMPIFLCITLMLAFFTSCGKQKTITSTEVAYGTEAVEDTSMLILEGMAEKQTETFNEQGIAAVRTCSSLSGNNGSYSLTHTVYTTATSLTDEFDTVVELREYILNQRTQQFNKIELYPEYPYSNVYVSDISVYEDFETRTVTYLDADGIEHASLYFAMANGDFSYSEIILRYVGTEESTDRVDTEKLYSAVSELCADVSGFSVTRPTNPYKALQNNGEPLTYDIFLVEEAFA